jgi:hypothetical protein
MSDQELPKASLRGDYQPATTGADAPDDVAVVPLPNYRLFSPKQIGVVAFLGGPVGAGIAFWANFKRLGEPVKAVAALLIGAVATIVLCVIGMHLPESFPRMALPIAYTLAISSYARTTLTAPFEQHVARQGKRASNWTAFGISIASLAVTLGVVMGVLVLEQPSDIAFGDSQVFYDDGGTQEQAQKLGDELTRIHYFTPDHGASVTVKVSAGRHVIAFVVRDSALVDPKISDTFRSLAPELSNTVFGGEPVDLWLTDDQDHTKVRLMWHSPAVAP